MNKLLLFAVLCVAFASSAQEAPKDDKFILDLDDTRCCKTKCLNSENSRKIIDALLDVLDKCHNSLQCLLDLGVINYMYSFSLYQNFSANIKDHDYSYEGFFKLQKYVYEFELCKKECKVFYELRKALIDRTAAYVSVDQIENDDGSVDCVVQGDTMIVLSVFIDRLKSCISDDIVSGFQIISQTLIIDDDMDNVDFHGMNAHFEADTIFVPYDTTCDFRGLTGLFCFLNCRNQLTNPFFTKDANGNTEPDGVVEIIAGEYDAYGNWDVYPY